MKQQVKIILGIIVLIVIVVLIGTGIWYQTEQSKLTVAYILSKSKAPEKYIERICYTDDCADGYDEEANIYKYSGSPDFDKVIELTEISNGDTKQYAFRKDTGWNNMKDIEVGRIELPYADKNASTKCTFNYRGNLDWQPCTEAKFIKVIPVIARLKEEKGRKYEELAIQMRDLQKDCDAERINMLACMQEYSKLDREVTKAFKELKNATIDLE